jgi:hypothetical protein
LQVDGYLNNEEETQNKKIIWEEMNKEYLEVVINMRDFLVLTTWCNYLLIAFTGTSCKRSFSG